MAAQTTPKKHTPDWKSLIAEFEKSGDTAAEFCKARGLNTTTFYGARSRLRARARRRLPMPPSFAPVRIIRSPAEAGLELVLKGGRVLKAPFGIPAQRLAELADALEGRPC